MSTKIVEQNFSNCRIFIEPYYKHKYQEQSIRENVDDWVQINCAQGKHITVTIFSKTIIKVKQNMIITYSPRSLTDTPLFGFLV